MLRRPAAGATYAKAILYTSVVLAIGVGVGAGGCDIFGGDASTAPLQEVPLDEHPAAAAFAPATIPIPIVDWGKTRSFVWHEFGRPMHLPGLRVAVVPFPDALAVVFPTGDTGRWEIVWAELHEGWQRVALAPELAEGEVESLDAMLGPEGRAHLALRTQDGRLLYGTWRPGEDAPTLSEVPVGAPIPASGDVFDVAVSVSPAGRVAVAYAHVEDRHREVHVAVRDLDGRWSSELAVPHSEEAGQIGALDVLTFDVHERPVLGTSRCSGETCRFGIYFRPNGVAWEGIPYSNPEPGGSDSWRGWGDLYRLPDGEVMVAPGRPRGGDYHFGVLDAMVPWDNDWSPSGVEMHQDLKTEHNEGIIDAGGRIVRNRCGGMQYWSTHFPERGWIVQPSYCAFQPRAPVLVPWRTDTEEDGRIVLSHGEYAPYMAGICLDEESEHLRVCIGGHEVYMPTEGYADVIPETGLPTFAHTEPAHGATDVPLDTSITVRFSRPFSTENAKLYLVDLTLGEGAGTRQDMPPGPDDVGPWIPHIPSPFLEDALEEGEDLVFEARPDRPLLPGHTYGVHMSANVLEEWWYLGTETDIPVFSFTTVGTADDLPEAQPPTPLWWQYDDLNDCAVHPVSGVLTHVSVARNTDALYPPAQPEHLFALTTSEGAPVDVPLVVEPKVEFDGQRFFDRYQVSWDTPLPANAELRLHISKEAVSVRELRPAADDPGFVLKTHHGDLDVVSCSVGGEALEDGAVGVAVDAPIDLLFNADLDPNTIGGVVSLRDESGAAVSTSSGQSSTDALQVSHDPLVPGTTYTLSVSGALEPACGDGFTTPPWTLTFTTAP